MPKPPAWMAAFRYHVEKNQEDVVIPEALSSVVAVAAWLACLATVMGFLGRWGWLFELASHFRRQYCWMLIGSAALLSIARRWPEAAVAAGGALSNGVLLVPLRARAVPGTDGSNGRIVRALSANLFSSRNRSYERVRRLIREADPDVIALQEVTPEWLAALQGLQAAYPFSKAVVHARRFGIMVLSRIPFERVDVVRVGAVGLPSIIARLQLPEERRLTVISTHPFSPVTPARAKSRNLQLRALAEFVSSQQGPRLVLGDLNTTSWSPMFQDFLRRTRFRDSRIGFGLQPTWPVAIRALQIPLDHCLVSSEIVVHRRAVWGDIGSDHYPIVVDVSIARG